MLRTSILLFLTLTLAISTQAKEHKQKQPKKHLDPAAKNLTVESQANFSPAERNLIRAQVSQNRRMESRQGNQSLPPGLQKKVSRGKSLPPGWQKKVTPGQSLDFHVYRQGESLPEQILLRLPPAPIGTEIVQIQNKIIRLNSATRTILDVFDLAPAQR